jgi:flagellar basal body P-ring formation protein FlgA
MPSRSAHALLALALWLLAAAAAAQVVGFEPVEQISAAAIAAAAPDAHPHGPVRAEASIDPGLRMPACEAGLSAHVGHRGVVEVACAGPMAWRLFVPVKVTRLGEALVLLRSVPAGQTISLDMLKTETRDLEGLAAGALARPEQAVGRIAARSLMAGSPLLASDLKSPRLIRRGDQVTLVARRGGLEVRSLGKALGEAGEDEQVNVENASSRRQVRGRVNAAGEVEVLQ